MEDSKNRSDSLDLILYYILTYYSNIYVIQSTNISKGIIYNEISLYTENQDFMKHLFGDFTMNMFLYFYILVKSNLECNVSFTWCFKS